MDMHIHRFKITNIEMTLDVNYKFDDNAAIYLNITHDYLNRRFPIVQFALRMNTGMISKLYEYRDSAILKFDVYQKEYDEDDKVLNTVLYLKHSFKIIPMKDVSEYITSTVSSAQKNSNVMMQPQGVEMYLIDMDIIKVFTQEISTIFKNSSKPAALHALYALRGVQSKNVIATPPNNIGKINYMCLQLGDLVNNINQLNKSYGLYTSYPIIYHDLNYYYCIDRITPNIILKNRVDYNTITLLLKDRTSQYATVTGSYNDIQSKTHYVAMVGAPIVNDYSPEIGSAQFATVAGVDSSGNVSKKTIDRDATKIDYVYKQNDLTLDQEINEKYRTSTEIKLTVANCAASIIRPYKLFTFITDTQYKSLNLDGNKFRISKTSINIQKDGDQFHHTIDMILYKI